MQANSVITLATKIDKEALAMKRARYTGNMTLPSSSASTHTAIAPLHTADPHNSPPPDLLNIAQRAKMHENQLVRLANALPSMIRSAIKKALQPAKDLTSLCSTVDVLESKVVYDVDPSWKPGGVATTSYHELHTLPDNWVVQGLRKPLSLPPDPQKPTAEEIASWQFDATTYTWKSWPNH
ncbi:hypothetical protein HAX54_017973 [Datura stramonium]|uniref:Uncharacterized protein n=1 Tax=Datura stramonium TaxID=4076 RepID=A0ABS8UMP7_DATST|nr:hypothetical protein [Datura stramonium]